MKVAHFPQLWWLIFRNKIFKSSILRISSQSVLRLIFKTHVGTTFMMIFVVELMATQTGSATVSNIFEVRFTDTKIE